MKSWSVLLAFPSWVRAAAIEVVVIAIGAAALFLLSEAVDLSRLASGLSLVHK